MQCHGSRPKGAGQDDSVGRTLERNDDKVTRCWALRPPRGLFRRRPSFNSFVQDPSLYPPSFRIVDKSRASSMAGGSSTQSSLIFGFLVAFLGIFALGVTGGIAWPHIRRTVALRFGIFQAPEDLNSMQIHQQSIPELWDVCVRAVMRNTRVSECAWEHLRASTPLPLLRPELPESLTSCSRWHSVSVPLTAPVPVERRKARCGNGSPGVCAHARCG